MFPKLFAKKEPATDQKAASDKLFVYGTLMNLHAVRDIWNVDPEKIEKATMRGDLYSAESQPIMMEGKGTVHGLLLTIPEIATEPSIFDKYEACHDNSPDSFHLRILREAKTDKGLKTEAWVYVGNPRHKTVAKTCIEKNLILEGKWSVPSNWLHGPLE